MAIHQCTYYLLGGNIVMRTYINFSELFGISGCFASLVCDRRRWSFHISLTGGSSRLEGNKLNRSVNTIYTILIVSGRAGNIT
jgi:hypothetical protein